MINRLNIHKKNVSQKRFLNNIHARIYILKN